MESKEFKKIYIIGIEGAGTSALAQMYKGLGYEVSGSDDGDHFYGDILAQKETKVFGSFNSDNLPNDIDLVVHSTAFKDDNVEIAEAKKRGLKVISYPEALGEIFKQKFGIAVCGTHGKTTTSAMLSVVMQGAEADPSAIIGSRVKDWDSNALIGAGEHLIIEADEYQNKLKYYDQIGVILTSIDWDHPDFFPNMQIYKKAFQDFVERIPQHGFLVYCGDDTDVVDVSEKANCKKISYGFTDENDFIIKKQNDKFEIIYEDKSLGRFEIKAPGNHNILNATAAIVVCYQLKLDLEKVKSGLNDFQGTSRRFEYIGKRNEAILIDDYAHHPKEVQATLRAAKEKYPDKEILTIFHPHSFTRTEALLEEFAQSFDDANKVFILDIYGSARENQGNVSSKDLVDLINKYNPNKAEYISTIEEVIEFFEDKIGEGEVLISMGAGDVWRVTKELKE